MLCWICNKNEANSGEHKFKSSQLKKLYGKQFSEEIIYVKDDKELKLQGPNNKTVKFPMVICSHCNNTLTSPHDKAFDQLLNWSNTNFKQLKSDEFIDFKIVYGEKWIDCKRNLYKYMAKHAGCKIITGEAVNDITNLSNLIYNNINTNSFQIKLIVKEGFNHLDIILKQDGGTGLKFISNSPTVYYQNKFKEVVYFGGMTTYNWLSIAWVHSQNNFKTLNDGFTNQKESVIFFSFDEFSEKNEKIDWISFIDTQRMETLNDQIKFYDKFILDN